MRSSPRVVHCAVLRSKRVRTPDDAAWLAFDLSWLGSAASHDTSTTAAGSFPPPPAERQLNSIDRQEYLLIQQALQAEGNGIRRAAARLGITHQALLRRLEKWPELRPVTPRLS